MQRDRVARAHFQDVRRAAIKVSPYQVFEVYLAYGLIAAPSIARRTIATTDPNPRILYCATETLRDGASNEAFPIHAKRNPPAAWGGQRRRSSCGHLRGRRHHPTHLLPLAPSVRRSRHSGGEADERSGVGEPAIARLGQ